MSLLHRRHSVRNRESASILLEAILAAGMAMTTLFAIAPMFSRQIELSRRARDTDQLEATVNKDINRFRQIASFYRQSAGPYSSDLLRKDIARLTFTPATGRTASSYTLGEVCNGFIEFSFLSDFVSSVSPTPEAKELLPIPEKTFTNVPGYKLVRKVDLLIMFSSIPTLRLTYHLTPDSGKPSLAFHRTADIQIDGKSSC